MSSPSSVVISCQNLTKIYQPPFRNPFAAWSKKHSPHAVPALDQLSFQIKAGETVGIIGLNGSGKSTLLKILAGVTQPTSGSLEVKGNVAPLIELGAGFNPELTGRENIFLNGTLLGLDKKTIQSAFAEIVAFAELEKYIDQPVKNYSSGMYLRLAFAIAAQTRPQILLLDEILAVGDLAFQQKCLRRLHDFQRLGTAVIIVSHSISTVQSFCSRVLYLKQGKLIKDGSPSPVCDLYLHDLEFSQQPKSAVNPSNYQDRLYSPTYLTKFGSNYYLVDCWHHRLLYNQNSVDKIKYWSVLTDQISTPHSLASDGQYLLAESSAHHQIWVFTLSQHQLVQKITLPLPHLRPHRLIYDTSRQLFFCLCAQSQTLLTLQKTSSSKTPFQIAKTYQLPFLNDTYCRSLTQIGSSFYFIAGSDHYLTADRNQPPTYQPESAQIIKAKFSLDQGFVVQKCFPVPSFLANMNDLFFYQGYFYLTATPQTMVGVKDLAELSQLSRGKKATFSDLFNQLDLLGTPYYLSFIDGRLYIPEITQHSRLTSVKILPDNSLVDIKHQFDFGPPSPASLERLAQLQS